jgi:hypothetical protein
MFGLKLKNEASAQKDFWKKGARSFRLMNYINELITRAICGILHYNLILKFKHIIFHYKLKRHIKIYLTYLNKKLNLCS